MSKMHRYRKIMDAEDGFAPGYVPKFTTPEKYVEDRVKVLNQLGIYPTEEDITYLLTIKTEYAIDAAIKDIINKYWK